MTGAADPADARGHAAALAIAETRAWVRRVVVGLGLCPFAHAPEASGRIRYVATGATDQDALIDVVADALGRLVAASGDEVETTLIVCLSALPDFLDFNEFVGAAEACVVECGLEGVVQVVAFHPRFQFHGNDVDDIGNATNRSPYPTIQLLREASVERAIDAFGEPERIFAANIATMARLGQAGWDALRVRCRDDAMHEATHDTTHEAKIDRLGTGTATGN